MPFKDRFSSQLQENAVDLVRFEHDTYRTGQQPVGLLSRIAPSLPFYARVLGIVFRASRKAKRGGYDRWAWCGSSFET